MIIIKKTCRVLFLVLVTALVAVNASAFVINFDLQAWPGSASVTYSGQGALPDPGNSYWNSGGNGWEPAGYSQDNLQASDGTPTDVDFHVTYCKNINWNDVGNDLLSDYQFIDDPVSPATITISSLAADTSYRLYLYAAGNAANKGSKFTSNGVTKETTGTVSSEFIEGENYVILDTMSDANGDIIVIWELREGASQAELNGFQITDLIPHASDLSDNGKVDFEDFALLSADWLSDYEMTDFLKLAVDWLLITRVIFRTTPLVEMDAVEGIAYSSTLSDDLAFFDASQLSFHKSSGPDWLGVDPSGALSGVPATSDVGINTFRIQVQSSLGETEEATMDIDVHGLSSPESTVDFDPSGELIAQFSNGGYTESVSGGLNGSVGVTLGHAATTTLDGTQSRSVVFSNDGDAIRLGVFFKMDSFGTGTGEAGGQILRLGLTRGGSDDFADLPFATIELAGTPGSGTAHIVERDSASADTDTFTLTTNQWYYFETKFIYRGGTAVDYDMAVYNATGNGCIGSMLDSYATSQHQDNPELDDGAALYGGFCGDAAFDNGAAGVIDNFYVSDDSGWVVIRPEEYPYALRNPLKGFRPDTKPSSYQDPYAAVTRCYIRWNELENDETDGIDKIKTFCNNKWVGVENYNIKVIPRVYLDWDSKSGNEYWPADMTPGDYSSEQFKTRLRRLIQRLGQCWDNDPRVAWVQMGIIGYWGEHHHPSPTAEIQQLMGEEFTAAFPNKKVLVRHPWEHFTDFEFGGYWDSWAHWNQINSHGAGIDSLNTTKAWWKEHIWEGECAYNWGEWQIQPGDNPDDTLTDPVHRGFLVDTIRNLHCTALGWVSGYDKNDPTAVAGAEEVQRAFGYRFVLQEVRYPREIKLGQLFDVSFKVINTGSAPFYYDWPVELSLLDPKSGSLVWKGIFENADIRTWMPGDQWDTTAQAYQDPALSNITTGSFTVKEPIMNGTYILALAILDPAGNRPCLRFAIQNYQKGGRHPIGFIGIGKRSDRVKLDPFSFTDLLMDQTLSYIYEPEQ